MQTPNHEGCDLWGTPHWGGVQLISLEGATSKSHPPGKRCACHNNVPNIETWKLQLALFAAVFDIDAAGDVPTGEGNQRNHDNNHRRQGINFR